MSDNYEKLRVVVLRNLHNRRCWGGKHTSIENAIKGVPGHLIGDAKNVLNGLIKENLVLPKPAHYGLQVSLNPPMKAEIEKILGMDKFK